MTRIDVWSTDEELAAKAQQPLDNTSSYQLSSDGLLWVIIAVLSLTLAVLFVTVHDMGVQINNLHHQVSQLQNK